MFLFSNLLMALAKVLSVVLTLYMWLIIARAVLSWVNPDPYNAIVRFIYNATEPVLYRIRRSIPVAMGGLDLSPLLVLLAIMFLQNFLIPSLMEMALRLKF